MALSRREDVESCRRAFLFEAYRHCLALALPLIEEHPTLQLLQWALISLQRLGLHTEAAAFGRSCLALTAADPFKQALVRLTLGEGSRNAALELASSAEQRSQVHYYAGAQRLTLGDGTGARAEFDLCLRQGVDGLEVRCAEAERRRTPGEPGGAPGLDEPDLKRLDCPPAPRTGCSPPRT